MLVLSGKQPIAIADEAKDIRLPFFLFFSSPTSSFLLLRVRIMIKYVIVVAAIMIDIAKGMIEEY